ncbi:MAG: hypothetical protein WCE50_02485 [Candidatus Acidiferrum sp.]
MMAMRRKLVWLESQDFQGWACSDCTWQFKPQGPLVGESLNEMKMNYERQRDKGFASHVCAEHPRDTKKNL